MAKARRDAVEDVLGDESPILSTLIREAVESSPSEEEQGGGGRRSVAHPSKRSIRRSREHQTVKRSVKTKRLLVTSEEDRTIDELANQIGGKVGTTVQFSQVTRAMWALLLDTEEVMGRVHAPLLKRPANGSESGMAEFEADLANYLLELFHAIKKRPR